MYTTRLWFLFLETNNVLEIFKTEYSISNRKFECLKTTEPYSLEQRIRVSLPSNIRNRSISVSTSLAGSVDLLFALSRIPVLSHLPLLLKRTSAPLPFQCSIDLFFFTISNFYILSRSISLFSTIHTWPLDLLHGIARRFGTQPIVLLLSVSIDVLPRLTKRSMVQQDFCAYSSQVCTSLELKLANAVWS